MITVTLQFATTALAAAALSRMDRLDPLDNPAAGAEVPLALTKPEPVPTPLTSPELGSSQLDALFAPPAAPALFPAVTAPVPSVLTVPTLPAAALTSTGLDTQGLPWDGRIHASNKSTNQDGSWRQKRGLNDPALKARVEAELRAGMGAPVVPVAQALASLPRPAPTPPTAATVAPIAAPVPPLPAPPAAPVEPTPAAAAPALPAASAAAFLARISATLTADKSASAKLAQALGVAGLTGVGALLAPGGDAHVATVAAVFDNLMAAA